MNPTSSFRARGRTATLASSLALAALGLVMGGASAADASRCILALNKGAGVVGQALARETELCARRSSAGALPSGQSLRACVAEDASGRVGHAAARMAREEESKCAVPPPFGPTSGQEVLDVTLEETDELLADLLGPAFDAVDDLVLGASVEESCRRRVLREAFDLVGARLKEFLRCKKPALRTFEIHTAATLEACLPALVDGGKIEAARRSLDRVLAKACGGADLGVALPGACGEAGEAADCIEARAACRACRLIGRADHLDADCDAIDDGIDNGSCLAPDELPPECGNGVVESGEACDDGNLADGDCCSASCELEAEGSACTDDGDACTADRCDGSGTCDHEDLCAWSFVDVTAEAGLTYAHAYDQFQYVNPEIERAIISGGVAVGDYDGDDWPDLYAVGGPEGGDHLLRNRGDGTFEDVTAGSGIVRPTGFGSGPVFADWDGDGHLDLLVAGVNGTPIGAFRNLGNGTFTDVTAATGIAFAGTTFGATFGDYDLDGDLDVYLSHWSEPIVGSARLWRNEGDGTFTDVTVAAGLEVSRGPVPIDWSFTSNFVDIDADGWPDLLISADFGSSQIFRNDRDGTFTHVTTPVISDENGMGGAIGDYDNDGDFDWFVTSIWDPDGVSEGNWGITGNRLYRNQGNGVFDDVTSAAGVRYGYWGWGTCMADLDLDGHLDLFHVNGFGSDGSNDFYADPSRLFLSNGDGTFEEMSFDLGVVDEGQGRGLSCFDYDRDGDLDLLVANNDQPPRLWQNRAEVLGRHFLQVRLVGNLANSEAIGALVRATTAAGTQLRVLRAGSNYVSQDPAVAHFGLGAATIVTELRIDWPDGATTVLPGVAADQFLEISHP